MDNIKNQMIDVVEALDPSQTVDSNAPLGKIIEEVHDAILEIPDKLSGNMQLMARVTTAAQREALSDGQLFEQQGEIGVTDENTDDGYTLLAKKSNINKYAQHTLTCTLSSSSWSGLTQQLNISSSYTVTGNTKVDIQIDDTAYAELADAGCKGLYVANNGGSLVVHALGAAPTGNITVQLTVTEVMTL